MRLAALTFIWHHRHEVIRLAQSDPVELNPQSCGARCQTPHYLVLARFWCKRAESRRSYRKETKAVDRMLEGSHAELNKTDRTVYISLKTWDFLVSGDSDLHQKRARTLYLRMALPCYWFFLAFGAPD